MHPDIYRQAAVLFEQILALPEDQRGTALDEQSNGNAPLRSAVLRLLAAEGAADNNFLERGAMEDAAGLLAHDSLAPGTTIGNYRLVAHLGAGGMGVVYEAKDLRLGRRVALKVLPRHLVGQTEDRILRFRREARAASALDHPNIVAIFEADFDRDHHFIAMEFVEGKTLRQLARRNAPELETRTLLDIIGQTASALSAAHAAGIVHRDIKPENIMVRTDGFVKVLDFGLAKLREHGYEAQDLQQDLHTRPGNLAGTIQYLSPEQVLGKSAGPQSDLFSLGVIAYELATGVHPFRGPTDGAVFDAILNRNPPPPAAIRPRAASLDSLIMRAIEKDPDLRFQPAHDLRSVSRLVARGAPVVPSVRPAAHRWKWWQFAATFAAGAALTAIPWLARRPKLNPLPNHFAQMTFGEGEEVYPSFFPDGKQFIYSSSARGHWDIYLQRVGGSTAINLTPDSTDNNTEPALSPDGARIAFRSDRGGGGLFIMEATGENPRRITSLGHLPAWSPDSRSIVYCDDTYIMPNDRGSLTSRLHILDLTTNAERQVATGDAVQPSWSPHGNRIAYWGVNENANREIYTVPATGGAPSQVTHLPAINVNPVWAPSGREIYFTSDRGGTMNLWRVRIDERSGRTAGDPEAVTTPAVYLRYPNWYSDGSRFLYSHAENRISLASIAFDPSRLETMGEPVPAAGNFNVANFSVSPDETKVVHDTVGDPTENIWVVNLDGSGRRKLTSDSYRNRLPTWSPSGDEILFISTRSGAYQEWSIRADGSGLRQLTNSPTTVDAGVWIDGGQHIFASLFQHGLALIDPALTTPVTSLHLLPGAGEMGGSYAFAAPAENGLLIGYINGKGDNPLVIYSLADRTLHKVGISGVRPAWVPRTNNRYLIYARQDSGYLYDREQKREKRLFTTPHNQIYFVQMGAGGKRIYFSRTIRDAHVWMGDSISVQ